EEGVALAEAGVQGPAQAVVVEVGRGEVPEEVGPGLCGPGGEVDEGGGSAEPGGQQQAEDPPVGVGELGVRGQVAVDEGGDLEALQERGDQGQGSEGEGFVVEGGAIPGLGHYSSAGDELGWRPGG